MNKIELAPVAIFGYSRPIHLKETLIALSKNTLASETEVYVFIDGPKTDKDINKVNEVKNLILKSTIKEKFKKFKVKIEEKNKGLANSIIEGVNFVIDKHKKVIVLEDDLITDKYFLEYMNISLNKYANENAVWSISGYTPKIENTVIKDKYFFIRRPWSWGWATWENRWTSVDWNIQEYSLLVRNKKKYNEFNKCGEDLGEMLRAQYEGRKYINSWYIRFAFNQFLNNGLTLYPINSMVKNIGIDGTGTHSSKTNNNYWKVELKNKFDKIELSNFNKIHYDLDIEKFFFKKSKRQYRKGITLRYLDNLNLLKIARRIQKILIK
ncbi:MAG: hypothetical protein ACRC0W_01715 [Cetobacterium sp.]